MDGIVQKAFNKMMFTNGFMYKDENSKHHHEFRVFTVDEVKLLQQELIEDIKQEGMKPNDDWIKVTKLIGDSKE